MLKRLFSIFNFWSSAYKIENEQWTWVSYDEGAGKRVKKISADQASFEVLENKIYAKDKDHVFYKGIPIKNAEPSSFEIINNKGYTKDQHKVFLFYETILFADVESFVPLKWPYAKDKTKVYCGSLAMQVEKPEEFVVTNSKYGISYSSKKFFIQRNPEYAWLENEDISSIVLGEGAGKTSNEKFEGFKKLES